MQIDLPTDLFERLRERVQGNPELSEADVVRHALDTLDWLDDECTTPEQLADTLRDLDQSIAEIESGATLDLQTAKAQVQSSLGLSPEK
ncbi:hypothetical protein NG895_25060 [Aeoliella sp. ICT_H6.2]|uniref:Uncharacterized protein n=1 Tax=Aeoliella straminimaris TaxID=2954799 RepID=A0A9X2FFQ2_9BACT|nr:hypothetical protein [Aeoliella straminimaris]MCO6047182.1 hypothetical protein [Aeoliella straminimaris]